MKGLAGLRPSPAMVVALIALGVALGGTSYAALTITGKSVQNSSLTGQDVKNSSLSGEDLKTSSVSGRDIKNSSLGGADIVESSLGKVAKAGIADSANTASKADRATLADSAESAKTAALADLAKTATNAGAVGGVTMIPFVYRSDSTTSRTTLALVGGLQVQAACGAAFNNLVFVNKSGQNAELTITNADLTDENVPDNTEGKSDSALANDEEVDAATFIPNDDVNGQAGFVTSANKSVRVLYTLNQNVNGFDCSISGLVIG